MIYSFLLTFILCLLVSVEGFAAWIDVDCAQVVDIPQSECEALTRLCEETLDPGNVYKWCDDSSYQACDWRGVSCDEGHVINLFLLGRGLTGVLPDLSALTHLKELNLTNNKLTEAFSGLIGLTHLEILYLNNNQLTGSFPDLSSLKNLKVLSAISSIPSFFHPVSNQLTGPLPSVDFLPPHLERLTLVGNKLTGSLERITNWTHLKAIHLGGNELTGSIPDLSSLNQLQSLGLGSNHLTGTIPDLSALTELTSLGLGDNQLTGSIPDLKNLSHLKSLYLQNNQLNGSLENLSDLIELEELYLQNNQLNGPIPALDFSPHLWRIFLSNNQLCGEIPLSLINTAANNPPNDPMIHLENNHLTTSNPQLINFLDQLNPEWKTTQTPCPDWVTLTAAETPQASTCQNFDITIQVQAPETQALDTASAYLNFDPSLLEVVAITPGLIFNFVLENQFNNTTGHIDFTAGSLNPIKPTGSFELFTLTLAAKQTIPQTALTFNLSEPRRTEVLLDATAMLDEVNPIEFPIENFAKLTGKVDNLQHYPLRVHIAPPIPETLYPVITDNNGQFTLEETFAPGAYELYVSTTNSLQKKKSIVLAACDAGNLDFGSLEIGDLIGADLAPPDNQINSFDFSIFGTFLNNTAALPAVDYNLDGTIDADDSDTEFLIQHFDLNQDGQVAKDDAQLILEHFKHVGEHKTPNPYLKSGLRAAQQQTLTVEVQAQPNQPIDVVEIQLQFDPNQVHINQLEAAAVFDTVLQSEFDNHQGQINFVGGQLGPNKPHGSFTLVTIQFTALRTDTQPHFTLNSTAIFRGQTLPQVTAELVDSTAVTPMLVELAQFSAVQKPNKMILEWQTLEERNSAGFHIWQAQPQHGNCQQPPYTEVTRLTQRPIHAQGKGTTYRYQHPQLKPNACYGLQEIDDKGHSQFFIIGVGLKQWIRLE